MGPLMWIIEIATGYIFLSMLAGIAIDETIARRREHFWGKQSAGPHWTSGLWVPGYLRYVRRYHDRLDARDRAWTDRISKSVEAQIARDRRRDLERERYGRRPRGE